MLITHKFHLLEYDVPAPIVSNGMNLYPLGDDDRYLYANMFKGLIYMNVRKVTNAQAFSKEGLSFNSYEVGLFHKIHPELELAIAEKKSGVLDCYVGRYKLIRYHVESQLMEMMKIRATDDHQEYGDASICLDVDETRAFFGTFARVEEEFHQLIASLPPISAANPIVAPSAIVPASVANPTAAPPSVAKSTVAPTSAANPAVATTSAANPAAATTSASLKRKWSIPPTASTFQKRIATLQAQQKVPVFKLDLTKAHNM